MVATSPEPKKLTKKQREWVFLLNRLKGEYLVNFDQHVFIAVEEAEISLNDVDQRLIECTYPRKAFEIGEKRISAGFSRYGNGAKNMRAIVEGIENGGRECGTLLVGLAIAKQNLDIQTHVRIMMLGTALQFTDGPSSRWSPMLELGPGIRKLSAVYRSPAEAAAWGGKTLYLGFEFLK